MKRHLRPAYMVALALACGCNSGSNTAQNSPTNTPTQQTAELQPTIVDGVGTEPAQAVAVFLDSLRRGDEKTANGVLTSRAREEVQKTNYQIQPPGTPDGKYEIGRVGYPYPEKNVALVECQWTEPSAPGLAPDVMEIVCEVHQEADGWRISGLGFKIVGTEEALLLDFENAASLQATIAGATAPVQTQTAGGVPVGQQTATNVAPPAIPSGLPAFPPTPNLQPTAPAAGTQIALPPINNAPVQR